MESKDRLDNLKSQIIIRKRKHEEEIYTKSTLTSLIEKMKDDILLMKKNIGDYQFTTEKHKRELEKEKFKKTEIKEKYNKLHSSMNGVHNKNLTSSRENAYLAKYYDTVITQKRQFQQMVYLYFIKPNLL